MSIDRKLLAHIAGLARLSLGDEEAERTLVDLASVLDHVGQIDGLDMAGVAPSFQGAAEGGPAPALREDETAPSLPAAEVSALAPRWRDGHFAVPPVLERDLDGDHA